MIIEILEHPFAKCEIRQNDDGQYVGALSYKGFINGELSGQTKDSIEIQFGLIRTLLDSDGAMLRAGSILLGYHNGVHKGDVLLPDGESIGWWKMDDYESSYFFPEGSEENPISSISPWMLQDSIASWLERIG